MKVRSPTYFYWWRFSGKKKRKGWNIPTPNIDSEFISYISPVFPLPETNIVPKNGGFQ